MVKIPVDSHNTNTLRHMTHPPKSSTTKDFQSFSLPNTVKFVGFLNLSAYAENIFGLPSKKKAFVIFAAASAALKREHHHHSYFLYNNLKKSN